MKIGDVGVYNLLKDCSNATEVLTIVSRQYREWYPEPVTYKAWDGYNYTLSWKELLQLYFYCAKMKESEDDKLNVVNFFKKYGVEL